MSSATVQSGYKTPRGQSVPEGSEKPRRGNFMGVIPDGKRVYESRAARYRIQHTAPMDLRFSDGRVVKGEKPLVTQFVDFLIYLDEVKDFDQINMIEGHRDYGWGHDFWPLEERLTRARQKKINEAIKLLQDPEAAEAIMEALTQSRDVEFALPKRAGVTGESGSQTAG